jgi:hypothetical protein
MVPLNNSGQLTILAGLKIMYKGISIDQSDDDETSQTLLPSAMSGMSTALPGNKQTDFN